MLGTYLKYRLLPYVVCKGLAGYACETDCIPKVSEAPAFPILISLFFRFAGGASLCTCFRRRDYQVLALPIFTGGDFDLLILPLVIAASTRPAIATRWFGE
jgi:hypothetical protein